MSEVFISYRQTDDEQKQRVRSFAERVRDAGVNVILDQFFRDNKAGGPSEGWPKWSSDNALNTEFVLIIGTQGWFECFEGTQKPGTGLGAACEAADIRQRIYDAAGVIENIRVVLFDDAARASIPGRLRPYHHFHSERDFEDIVRWLGGALIVNTPRTSVPHNLPSLQPFFGREEELKRIADALDPESRTWGALIDGPGGMGKTSLAVRAAYDASVEDFDKIVFVSLKSRELDDDGVRDLSGFLISGLAELLNELSRELGHPDIAKVPEEQRPKLLLNILRGTCTLLLLDNLESLVKRERDIIFTFVDKLPSGCKAILTARGRIGSGAKELILQELSESAALATLAQLAESNPALAKTSEDECRSLYRETGGNPLLLRWTAGQIGRGSCLTLRDALAFLRSCPEGNDPLEFIFGDLVKDFSETETSVLCVLTYFTLPARAEHIAEVAGCSDTDAYRTLRSLVNRSLVVPSDELKTFDIVPLAADFLRQKKPYVLASTKKRLEERAFMLVRENGYNKHECYPILDAAWPLVAAALPHFVAGPNNQFQAAFDALTRFLDFTGRWDEWLALSIDAESRAVALQDLLSAGWRACHVGWVHHLRRQSAEVFASVDRSEAYWRDSQAGPREHALAKQLRGIGYGLSNDYAAAILAHREAVDLLRSLGKESMDLATALNALAGAEAASGDIAAAERDFSEALRIARLLDDHEGIANYIGNLAAMALRRKDWPAAQNLAQEALILAERIGRQELIASNCHRVAETLVHQEKFSAALPYATRAVEIFSLLRSTELAGARRLLATCEEWGSN